MVEILSVSGCYPVTVNCGSCGKRPEDIDPLLTLYMSIGSCIARALKTFYIENDITVPMMTISLSFDTLDKCNILVIDITPVGERNDLLYVFAERIPECQIVKMLNMKLKLNISK